MKKIMALVFFFVSIGLFAEDRPVSIQIDNIKISGGKLYVAIYNSSASYKKQEPFKTLSLDPTSDTLVTTEALPDGEYVVSLFQDTNNNKKCDLTVIGIPKEPVGISRYDGKGIPGGFEKLKVQIGKENQAISVQLYKI